MRDARAKLLFFAKVNLLLFCRSSRRCLSPLTGFVWTGSRFVYGNPVFFPTADQENILVANGIMGYRLWKRQAENH